MNSDSPAPRRRRRPRRSWVGDYVTGATGGDVAEVWAEQMNAKHSRIYQLNWNNPGGNVFIGPGE